MSKLILAARNIFLVIGALLLFANIPGLFLSLRPHEVYRDFDDISLSERAALEAIKRLPYESDLDFLYRITAVVDQAIAFDWSEGTPRRYSLEIPWWENWILAFIGGEHEFINYRKAIERGTGWCSQHALAEWDILNKNGIEADILALDGHVALRVFVDGNWYVVDPVWSIVIPYDLQHIERNPLVLSDYYPTEHVDYAMDVYASSENNTIIEDAEGYQGGPIERASYTIVWLLPLVCLTFSGILHVLQRFFIPLPRTTRSWRPVKLQIESLHKSRPHLPS